MTTGPFTVRGYTLQRRLGCGGAGEVWQAQVTSTGAAVALKRIAVDDDDQRRRARAEAALLAALDHPNLIRLHSMIETDDALVLVLDLAAGGSLADLLTARGRVSPGEVVTAISPVAAAVAYLHDEGVVHGDISAANILFSAEGVAFLADVGVARLTGDDAPAAAAAAYLDPTVAAGGVPGPPSDVHMLGGVALHALTGSPPWMGDTAAATLDAARVGEVDAVGRLLRAGVEPAMVAVLNRALAADPQRRGTAAELALDLRHSATPVALELTAGLARHDQVWVGPRHAAPPRNGAARTGAVPARPAFERPGAHLPAGGGAPPTRMVGPRPRPVVAPPSARRWSWPRWARAPLAGAVAIVAVLAVAGLVWARSGAKSSPHPRPTIKAQLQLEPIARTSGHGSTPPPARMTTVTDRWVATLHRLDAVRGEAFARRDPGRLRRVYTPGPLLRADTRLLDRLVPEGCVLVGVRTTYTGARAHPAGRSVILTVSARLAPSRLICSGRVRAGAAGTGPVALRVELVRTADGPRIAAQRGLLP